MYKKNFPFNKILSYFNCTYITSYGFVQSPVYSVFHIIFDLQNIFYCIFGFIGFLLVLYFNLFLIVRCDKCQSYFIIVWKAWPYIVYTYLIPKVKYAYFPRRNEVICPRSRKYAYLPDEQDMYSIDMIFKGFYLSRGYVFSEQGIRFYTYPLKIDWHINLEWLGNLNWPINLEWLGNLGWLGNLD